MLPGSPRMGCHMPVTVGRRELIAGLGSTVAWPLAARAQRPRNSPLFNNRRRQLAALTTRHGVPAIGSIREFVLAGGLMSYAASDTDAYRRAGSHYVASILRGTKPGDLPVEMPTKYELVISVVAAKALGLDVPAKLLALADEVIE